MRRLSCLGIAVAIFALFSVSFGVAQNVSENPPCVSGDPICVDPTIPHGDDADIWPRLFLYVEGTPYSFSIDSQATYGYRKFTRNGSDYTTTLGSYENTLVYPRVDTTNPGLEVINDELYDITIRYSLGSGTLETCVVPEPQSSTCPISNYGNKLRIPKPSWDYLEVVVPPGTESR